MAQIRFEIHKLENKLKGKTSQSRSSKMNTNGNPGHRCSQTYFELSEVNPFS